MPLALAQVKIYRGAAAGFIQGVGYGSPLVASAITGGEVMAFAGVFTETYDNTAGTAGGYFTTVRRTGCAQFSQTGTTITFSSMGQPVYFSDDNTVTLSSGTIYAGVVAAIDASGGVWVDITSAVNFPTYLGSAGGA
jgi:hypothetical protein